MSHDINDSYLYLFIFSLYQSFTVLPGIQIIIITRRCECDPNNIWKVVWRHEMLVFNLKEKKSQWRKVCEKSKCQMFVSNVNVKRTDMCSNYLELLRNHPPKGTLISQNWTRIIYASFHVDCRTGLLRGMKTWSENFNAKNILTRTRLNVEGSLLNRKLLIFCLKPHQLWKIENIVKWNLVKY